MDSSPPPLPNNVPDTGIHWLDYWAETIGLAVVIISALAGLYLRYLHPQIKALRAASEKAAGDQAQVMEAVTGREEQFTELTAQVLTMSSQLKGLTTQVETMGAQLKAALGEINRLERDVGGLRSENRADRRAHQALAEHVTAHFSSWHPTEAVPRRPYHREPKTLPAMDESEDEPP